MPLSEEPAQSLAGLNRNRAVLSRRPVNGFNRGQVPQTFHSIGLRIPAPVNRLGEGVEFESKFIDHLELLLEPSALNLAKKTALLFKSKCGIQGGPTPVAMNLYERSGPRAVTGCPLANQAVGMRQAKGDAVF